jgi:hypothetical protein
MQVYQFAEFGRSQRGIAITKVLDDAHASSLWDLSGHL